MEKPTKGVANRPVRWVLAASTLFAMAPAAVADEGGVSFWLPGLFGSLAATPQVPGWSLGIIALPTSASAFGKVATARGVTIGQFNPTLNLQHQRQHKCKCQRRGDQPELCI
jgi:hypothetical protein